MAHWHEGFDDIKVKLTCFDGDDLARKVYEFNKFAEFNEANGGDYSPTNPEAIRIINEIISKDSIVNYDKLKQYFISYCEEKMPSKLKIIDDQFILLISREMDLDNLKKIILNEDIIPEIIESYELKYNNN